MNPEEWRRIKAAVAATLEAPQSEREELIASLSAGDATIEREIHSLVAAAIKASGFFETGAFLRSAAARLEEATAGASETSGFPSNHRAHLIEPGDLINGRYRIESMVGRGGMGSVYRAFDAAKQRTVALKIIQGKIRSVDLFQIEFRTLAEFRHPHLARSYDFDAIAGTNDYFFTMDFVEGIGIYDATAGLDWNRVLDLVVQVCRALAYVHSRGISHRDIKPGNVMVQHDGVVKLLDFGLVGSSADLGLGMGTPSYLAPEVRDHHHGDQRSDLYSLGILAYQLIMRELPFAATELGDLRRQHAYSALPWSAGAFPEWVRAILDKLCAKEPSDRYRSANQVIEAINSVGGMSYALETAATRESYVLSGLFVGREKELEALSGFVRARLAAAPLRVGPIGFVAGASGLGKSRLLREFRHRMQLEGRVIVDATCYEGAASEYGAVADLILQLVPVAETYGADDVIDRHAAELSKVAPLMRLPRPASPALPLATAEAERRRMFDAVGSFLVELSRAVPFAFVLDDGQWAPQGTVDILRYLIRRVTLLDAQGDSVQLACWISLREGEVAGRPLETLMAEAGIAAPRIDLPPLGPLNMEALLVSMFGLGSVPEAFVSRVLDETAGSPFFLEEVVRGLVEDGSVFIEQGTWRTTSSLGQLEIPHSVIAALHRRLQMITHPHALDVLRMLAAYTKPMPMRLLAVSSRQPVESLEEAIYELSRRQMIVPVAAPDPCYRTVHDHLRTTVYNDLGPLQRTVHLGIAQGLRELHDRGDSLLSDLAHHYWAAGEREDSLHFGALAARSALERYANDEAIEHLEHVLELLPAGQTAARAATLEQLADANFLSGRYHRADALLQDADICVVDTIDKARILRKRAEVVGYSLGTPADAVEIMWSAARQLGASRPLCRATFLARTVFALARHLTQHAVRSALPRVSDKEKERRVAALSSTYLRIATFNFFGDPLLFFLPIFRAANLVDRIPGTKEHAQVYSLTAIALGGLGMQARALRYGKAAIEEAKRCQSPWHDANAQSFHAMVLLQAGQWSDAREHADRACQAFSACGDHFELAVSACALLETLRVRGELQAARTRGSEQLAVFERLALQMIGKGLYTALVRVLGKIGDEQALSIGSAVLARARQGADKLSAVYAEVALGDALLEFGHIDQAIDHLEQGLVIRDRDRFHVYVVAEGSALLARAYAAKISAEGLAFTGNLRRAFERRMAQAAAAGKRFGPMRSPAFLVRGLADDLAGNRRRAARNFDRAAALAAEFGAPLWEADARFENGLGWLRYEGGRSTGARAQIEAALHLYQSCGAAPGERRARAVLLQFS